MADRADITFDRNRLVALLDRVSTGAASQFLTAARRVLEPIADEASANAPRKTGAFADGLRVTEHIGESRLAVSVESPVAYARYVRHSVRLRASLDAEADRAAQRGETPETREQIRRFIRRRLTRRHGHGAPSEAWAGRNIYAWIRTQGRRESQRFIADQRRALERLAEAP